MVARGESWTLKRVLCATDFSDNAAGALEAAVALARPANARILFVHVTPGPVYAPGQASGGPASRVTEQARADLAEHLDRFARPAIAAGVGSDRVLRRGDPAEEIVREAGQAGVDLIILGRHSRGSPDHWFLGSVAERVVKKTPCPVMVVAPSLRQRDQGPRHVICAIDLGETTAVTLAHAAALTTALDGDLLVLHVVAGLADGTVEDVRGRLSALVTKAAVPPGRVQQRVVAGRPQQEILGAGHEGGSDLLVVGTHGGGIVDRQFIGSTTLHVLRRSECDVLVVPAPVSPLEARSDGCSAERSDTPPAVIRPS